jgi:hypothetical protein
MASTFARGLVSKMILGVVSIAALQGRAADGSQPKASAPDGAEAMVVLETRIKALIANPICESDADCRAIGFGAKACGGPKSYLYYSIKTLDEGALKKQVEDYNALERKRNQETGVISNCSMVQPLTPRCVATNGKKLCQGVSP